MMNKKGLTLIEIIIVLAIAMILLVIGVFNYQGSKASSELTITAEELFGNLKFARQYALSSGGSSVTFASGRYYVKSAAGETLKTKVLPSHIALGIAPSGVTAVTFSSNGSADYDATVTISSSKTNRTKTITVTAASGMIYKN